MIERGHMRNFFFTVLYSIFYQHCYFKREIYYHDGTKSFGTIGSHGLLENMVEMEVNIMAN